MSTISKYCQSCGMPLKKDPQGSGTNQDGSKSTIYCSYCYINGAFKTPNMTLQEMQTLVKTKLKEKGMPGFIAWFFASNISKLERWKK